MNESGRQMTHHLFIQICRQRRFRWLWSIKIVTIVTILLTILQCRRAILYFLQIYNFQASLNHRANPCSCFFHKKLLTRVFSTVNIMQNKTGVFLHKFACFDPSWAEKQRRKCLKHIFRVEKHEKGFSRIFSLCKLLYRRNRTGTEESM
jgi:hypothetical protein